MTRFFMAAGIVLAALMSGLPAWADTPSYGKRIARSDDTPVFNYSGIYIDVAGGKAFTAGEVSVDPLSIDSLAAEGWRGQVRLGIDWHLGQSPFLVGLFVGYGVGETEFSTDFGPTNLLHATLTPTWHAGGRVGLVNGRALFYAGVAWQQAEFDWSAFDGTFGDSQTVDGWKGMLGIEYVLSQQVSLGLEYGHTWYDDVTIKGTSVNVDLRDHEVLIRLKWRPLTGVFN